LSRAETGRARLAEEIDLRALAEDVSSHLGVLADEKRQSIDIAASPAPYCRGDRVVLRQALINLVHNAIRYAPEGGTIRLGFEKRQGRAIVEIGDSGPGIPAGPRARLFERFGHRPAPGGPDGGAGLGLPIAKWAVEANGGHLSLVKTDATGTVFRMSFPGIEPVDRLQRAPMAGQ
jgi:signal transduction histidine kinase